MDILLSGLYYCFSFIVVVSIIVFIHEYGHYAVAKLSGVKIEAFSIGFGKELWGWNDRSGTRWKISIAPLGGYVKMFGDLNAASVPDNETTNHLSDEERKKAFAFKPLPIKAAIVAAGPLANFLLAIIILTGFFYVVGKADTTPYVSEVVDGGAAQQAGVEVGDVFLELDGQSLSTFGDLQRIVSLNVGTPMVAQIKRGNEHVELSLTPIMVDAEDGFGNPVKMPRLGIRHQAAGYSELALGGAFVEAVSKTYYIAESTLVAVGQMITGERGVKELSGPIGIAKYSGQSIEQGWLSFFWFMAVLSINLGLINLFPIPLLDGGHLLYYAVEAVRGKPMADKVQDVGFKIGMILIVGLAIFAILNDVRKMGGF